MKTARTIAAVILVVVACAVAVAVRSWRSAKAGREQSVRVSRELAAAKDTLFRLRGRLEAAEMGRDKLQIEQAEKLAQKKPAQKSGWLDWMERLKTDPRTQARYLEYEKSGLALQFGQLFKEMHLSADQVARCEAAIIRRKGADMDINAALQNQGIVWSDPVAQKMYADAHADYKAALTGILGDEGFKQWNSYEGTIPARMSVAAFAGTATLYGIPPSPDQVQQLVSAAIRAGPGQASPDWNAVEAQGAAILTPAQLDLLSSGEFSGPGGYGSKHQALLNDAITQADHADIKAGISSSPAGQSNSAVSGSH
jgi:hypothetical protein